MCLIGQKHGKGDLAGLWWVLEDLLGVEHILDSCPYPIARIRKSASLKEVMQAFIRWRISWFLGRGS